MATKVIPKTELRDRIRIELGQLGEDSLLITERGRPLAVVVAVARWNHLQDRIEDLEDALAVLEYRLDSKLPGPAESVFSTLEIEDSDVSRSSRQTG